jgi:membrane protease YdiL (CAAX protease family)
LFIWIVICGGLILPMVAQLVGRSLGLGEHGRIALVNLGFQGGMLAGVAVYHVCFNRTPARGPLADRSTLAAGGATFLMSLPVVLVVGLLWTGLVKLCGLPVEPQEAVSLFRKNPSPLLLVTMVILAAGVAPVTEEFIFRAGVFRYVRTRVPRWAALLLPACLFAAMHNHLPSFGPLAALGVIFSLAYERTGRIGTAIVAHAMFNSYSVLRIVLDPTAS